MVYQTRGRASRPQRGAPSRFFRRKKPCRFCVRKDLIIDYKDIATLKNYITDRGKIKPRRFTGNCARHQQSSKRAVKRARFLALMPYVA